MDEFYRCWFSGVEDYLGSETTTADELEKLLLPCAIRCSDSYPLVIYKKAFAEGASIEDALKSLKSAFGDDFSYRVDDRAIVLRYAKCGCVLVSDKLMTNARLCKCSELSLLYIWESLFGKSNVRVRTLETVLGGDGQCLFEIKLRQSGHFN